VTTGLAGSSPFALHQKFLNQILLESVQAKWPDYCTDPSVSEITWWNVEPPIENDVAISFELLDQIVDFGMAPIGWKRERVVGIVVIHVYANHDKSDEMPPYMVNIANAIIAMIQEQRDALVPNSEYVRIDRVFAVPRESPLQRRWHWYCSVSIPYTQVTV